MKTIKWMFFFILILLLNQNIIAKPSIIKADNVPGGIAIKTVPCNCTAYFKHHRTMVLNENQKCFAIIGIPLTTKPGKQYLTIKQNNTKTTIPINISTKQYPTKYLIIQHKKTTVPKKEIIARLKRERKIIAKIFSCWTYKKQISLDFKLPLTGRLSSPFGARRIINKTILTQHRGIDIAAKTGTPVKAPANGIIINTGNYLLLGNAIFIDHGQGLITIYCHLSKILVKPKQLVKRGQIIGRVGSTGRSTGPHLHWGISLNNTRVNPLLFISQF
ncbi:MAG: peptidoglycan DD-metalloendopeptidase family protein [Gammaproteobacteria bacterium]|jgi:murein DD-endopeptidase MepM/ murein hydrolase activator NlpD